MDQYNTYINCIHYTYMNYKSIHIWTARVNLLSKSCGLTCTLYLRLHMYCTHSFIVPPPALQGYQCRNQFILTQGPLDLTIFDFWRMIWETRASTIVMLCQLQENDFVSAECTKHASPSKSTNTFNSIPIIITIELFLSNYL